MADALMLMVWNRSQGGSPRTTAFWRDSGLLLFCRVDSERGASHQRICRKSKSASDGLRPPLKLTLVGYRIFGDGYRHHANLPYEQQSRDSYQPLSDMRVTMACTSHVTAYIAHNVTILVFALNTNMIATATPQ